MNLSSFLVWTGKEDFFAVIFEFCEAIFNHEVKKMAYGQKIIIRQEKSSSHNCANV